MHYLSIYVAMIVGAICTLIAMTVMRRSATHSVGKLGWIALILLSPPLGLLLFIWLGGRKISAEHEERELVDLSGCSDESAADSSLARIGVKRGLNCAGDQNRLVLLDTPQAIYEQLFELVESAEHRLLIHSFILTDDELGKRLIEQLCTKAKDGVDVRLMIDGFGSFVYPDSQLQRLRDAGGKATRFKPVGNLSKFAYLNFRNHRKIVVADGQRAMVGGANLVGYELTESPDENTWIDLSLRVDGMAVKQIEAVLASDWQFVTGESTEFPEIEISKDWSDDEDRASLQIVPIGPDSPTEIISDLWLTAISLADEKVWIVTPYFVPPPSAMRALVRALRRGVQVRIVVPDKSDMRPADFARLDYFRELEELGAAIYRHPDRVVHSKALLVDDNIAYVGSANFDMRSFFLNYELVVGIHNEKKIKEVQRWYESLSEQCDRGIRVDTRLRRMLATASRMVAEEL